MNFPDLDIQPRAKTGGASDDTTHVPRDPAVAVAYGRSKLPTVITDIIIDHLHDDPLTLSACGLVSSSWIHTVRFHRFRAVGMRTYHGIAGLYNLLQHGSPALGPYVQSLSLIDSPSQTSKTEPQIEFILSKLTCLRTLRLAHLILTPAHAQRLFAALPKSIEAHEINQMDIPSLGHLILLWTSLPRLRSFTNLEMLYIRSPEISDELCGTPLPLKISLSELHLRWSVRHADVLARWLVSRDIPAQFRRCSLYVNAMNPPAYAVTIMRALGPSLESLELFVHTNHDEWDDADSAMSCE